MSARCAGSNALLRDGAVVVRDAQDALDEALGVGVATVLSARNAGNLEPSLRGLLRRVEGGPGTVSALAASPAEAQLALAGLTELEQLGFVRRAPGGRYVRVL
jgi:predicted Rossmann fold nucleotide-binding protein DprA/Smf involved in DNA uptake